MEDKTEECPDCDGNGVIGDHPCATCGGFGYLEDPEEEDSETDG